MEKNEMTVLLVEPEEHPKVVTIGTGLEALQKAVDGWIEAVYPFEDPVALIVNEEGKLNHLPPNRALRHKDGEIYDIIAGNMLVVGLGEEDFTSLSPKLMAKYKEYFHHPEVFFHIGRKVVAVPLPDNVTDGVSIEMKPLRKREPER
jgi:hypothetical protein